ncbi:protein of unknown function [Marinobacterium stanieri]|uniref:Protein-glutamine gamma-glutamyltransferase-like C-terminal domain-containing protein n=2 Tax=Marinobacterium stanieri TaxID=49186 RepID=A0A1N6W9F3_9GAMM|nr:protein of unknown function [Marinobacterium stanieri]
MARRWFWPLWISWFVPATVLFVLLSLFFYDSPWIVMSIIWWLKPVLERLPLLFVSRFLFNEGALSGVTWRQIRSTLLYGGLVSLTWLRLDPKRSFIQPVIVLEKQKGRARRVRSRVLSYNSASAATWLTVVMAHVEWLLFAAGPVLLMLLLGTFVELEDFWLLGVEHEWLAHGSNVFTLICMSVVAPFYVACGFSLYINRRIELEAWDLELLFRQIASQRTQQSDKPKRSSTAALLLVFNLTLVTSFALYPGTSAWADSSVMPATPEQSKEQVMTMLESPPFTNEKEVTTWHWKDAEELDAESGDWLKDWFDESGDFSWDGTSLFQIAEVLVWVAVALLLIFLARVLVKYVESPVGAAVTESDKPDPPRVLMGLSIDAESIPADIEKAVTEALDQGDLRLALSLTYRYALHRLTHQYGVEVEHWQTELECAATVRGHSEVSLDGVFDRLTHVWLRSAYAHQQPSRAKVEELLGAMQKVLK